MPPDTRHILAINCGSSSIKAKLFAVGPKGARTGEGEGRGALEAIASASVKGIGATGERVKVRVEWERDGWGEDVDEEGEDGGEVEYASLPPLLLEKLTGSTDSVRKEDITHIAHRVVHGGPHEKVISITKAHAEGLKEMDTLSEFAPLHNHSAVLAVRACLDALPEHTSVLAFDTIFHQTIPREVYTYAIPPPDRETPVPIRKYGFHGLSYMSILDSMARKLAKPVEDVSIVVAHLGSGGSACCIRKGRSIDTSMGLTPLEGLVGGTRSGSIDPTAVFHVVEGCSEDAGIEGMKVTKAEAALNKKSGLVALAGTSNFGSITSGREKGDDRMKLAYDVYLDRLMAFLSAYLSKLFSSLDPSEIDGLVFSGGIGEKSEVLRADVARRLAWMGARLDERANGDVGEGVVTNIGDGRLNLWVVQTDEERVCAQMCQRAHDL